MLLRGLALLTSIAVLTGCENCPLIGCGPAIELSIGGVGDPMAPHSAFVDLELDGELFELICAPQSRCRPTGNTSPLFAGQADFIDGTIRLQLGSGGDAPQTARVWVTIDDQLVIEEELEPAYEESSRTGDDACGQCSYADIELVAASA